MLVRGTEAVFSVASGQDQGIRGIRDQAKRKQGHRGQAQKCNPGNASPRKPEVSSPLASAIGKSARRWAHKMGPSSDE
jgi:hypothetical protein